MFTAKDCQIRHPDFARARAEAWFCIQTHPKHEHIAATHLRRDSGLEVCLPRIRFRRSTREGPAWFTEALFPGYLFARFELGPFLRRVHHTHSVHGIVHFGDEWPTVPARVIEELRAAVGTDQVHVIHEDLRPGETALISGGPFHNLRAVITRVMPGRERVAVLLDFLGRQTVVELASNSLVHQEDARKLAL